MPDSNKTPERCEHGTRWENRCEVCDAPKTASAQTEALINSLMEQAQVFASAWSLVGGRFDGGNAMDDAEVAKAELRQMIEKALVQPEQEPIATLEDDGRYKMNTKRPDYIEFLTRIYFGESIDVYVAPPQLKAPVTPNDSPI